MWQKIEVTDLPSSDIVYQCSESGRYIKTRVLRMDDSTHPVDSRAKTIFLHVSGSACDNQGWALADGAGGYCIAPEHVVALNVGVLQADAAARSVSLAAAFNDALDKLRLDCCGQSAGIDEAIALKMAIPLKVEAP